MFLFRLHPPTQEPGANCAQSPMSQWVVKRKAHVPGRGKAMIFARIPPKGNSPKARSSIGESSLPMRRWHRAFPYGTSRFGGISLGGNSRKNHGFSPTRNVRFSLYNPLRHRRLRAIRPRLLRWWVKAEEKQLSGSGAPEI